MGAPGGTLADRLSNGAGPNAVGPGAVTVTTARDRPSSVATASNATVVPAGSPSASVAPSIDRAAGSKLTAKVSCCAGPALANATGSALADGAASACAISCASITRAAVPELLAVTGSVAVAVKLRLLDRPVGSVAVTVTRLAPGAVGAKVNTPLAASTLAPAGPPVSANVAAVRSGSVADSVTAVGVPTVAVTGGTGAMAGGWPNMSDTRCGCASPLSATSMVSVARVSRPGCNRPSARARSAGLGVRPSARM